MSSKPDDAKFAKGFILILLFLVIGIPLIITFSMYVVPTIWANQYLTYQGHDGWSTIPEIILRKSGVCRDYATLLLWKLDMKGGSSLLIVKRPGSNTTHACVLIGDDLVLDPTSMKVQRFGYFYNQQWEVIKIVPYNKVNSYVGRSVL